MKERGGRGSEMVLLGFGDGVLVMWMVEVEDGWNRGYGVLLIGAGEELNSELS